MSKDNSNHEARAHSGLPISNPDRKEVFHHSLETPNCLPPDWVREGGGGVRLGSPNFQVKSVCPSARGSSCPN